MADPRLYQIGVLSGLLLYGMAWLDFEITVPRAALLLVTVLATQALCDRLDGPRPANWKSALISGLSLCLLLRTSRPGLAVLAAVLAIAGKFVFRIERKHLFNPTNGGIVAMLLLTDQVWVSPGQWGSVAFFGFLMACLGGLVVNRASRSDVTYAFIALVLRAGLRTLALSRRADDDPASSAPERRAAAVHVLHDLGPQDDAGFESRARAVRRAGGVRRLVRAVPPVQDERAALVAGGLVDGGSAHRSAAAGRPLLVESTAHKEHGRMRRICCLRWRRSCRWWPGRGPRSWGSAASTRQGGHEAL